MEKFYFGCVKGTSGHYFYDSDLRNLGSREEKLGLPITHVDGNLAPKLLHIHQEEGKAKLYHKDGWTALAFWDRSGDNRYNSNSAFFFSEVLTFEEAIASSKEVFPTIWNRFKFEVVQI